MFRSEGLPLLSKRILFFAAVIATAALQNTRGLLPDFFGARLFPLIPLTICIGMCEGEISGLLYGAAAGAFWDICSASPEGMCALYLAFAGCVSGILVRFFMRGKLLTQYLLTSLFTVCFCALYWLFTVYIPIGDSRNELLLGFYMPTAVLTTAFSFIPYYFVRFISVRLKDEQTE